MTAPGGGVAAEAPRAERGIVALVGALQFVQAVDFMMVLPLGPDLAGPLGVGVSSLGLLAAAYTGAAAVTCTLVAGVLDRFDRRVAIGGATAGLVVATLACAAAPTFPALLGGRMLAGAFGGVAGSLGQSVIADRVPAGRRGRAMGAVMGANALGAVLGVPLGLWAAEWLGWRAPFLLVGAAGALLVGLAFAGLPPMRDHLGARADPRVGRLLGRPVVWGAWLLVFLTIAASFLLTPNLSAFVQENLGFPRDRLPWLYAVGGGLSVVTMRGAGWLVDRFGAFPVGTAMLATFAALLLALVGAAEPWLPVAPGFVALLVTLAGRNVAVRALTTRVPGAHERARFLALQNGVHHAAAAVGAGLSAALLRTAPDGALVGMPRLGALAIAATAITPVVLWAVERAVRRSGL